MGGGGRDDSEACIEYTVGEDLGGGKGREGEGLTRATIKVHHFFS